MGSRLRGVAAKKIPKIVITLLCPVSGCVRVEVQYHFPFGECIWP